MEVAHDRLGGAEFGELGEDQLHPRPDFFVGVMGHRAIGQADETDGQGQGTITDPTATGQLLISEFRFRGPTFSAPQNIDGFRDEYVELYNNTNQAVTVATTDGSAGWTIASLNATGTGADTTGITATGEFSVGRSSSALVLRRPDRPRRRTSAALLFTWGA